MDLYVKTKFAEFKMNERIEFLREELYKAIDNGNTNEIFKASVTLDIEIVKAMVMSYTPNKIMCSKRK
jgi:hypothetical protein